MSWGRPRFTHLKVFPAPFEKFDKLLDSLLISGNISEHFIKIYLEHILTARAPDALPLLCDGVVGDEDGAGVPVVKVLPDPQRRQSTSGS